MQSTSFRPFGLQAGDDETSTKSSYATSMVYNDHNKEITILGATYSNYFYPEAGRDNNKIGSDCFVAIQRLRYPGKLSWVRRRQYGNPSVQEFCSDIHSTEGGRYIAVGYSGDDGILSHMLPYADTRRSVYGILLDIDENIDLEGGLLLHSNQVQYPIAVTTDETGNEIFVAEIFSDEKPEASDLNPMLNGALDGVGEDASATAYSVPVLKLSFSVRLQKLEGANTNGVLGSGVSESFHSEWSREYGAMAMENVQVSTLDYLSPSMLLMTGFTRGQGEAFGRSSDNSIDTLDSFVTILDPSSGQILGSKRIESVLPGDDRILGTCRGNRTNEVYIVGMTSGVFDATYTYHVEDGSIQHNVDAFIQKIDLDEMKVMWSRQLGAIFYDSVGPEDRKGAEIHGLACAVTPDGEEVFLAGNVNDGASLVMPTGESFVSGGGTDIFVTKFHAEQGTLIFATQIGSMGDDSLASKKSLTTDEGGNLIILGNTNGSMYRKRSQPALTTEIFTMSVGRARGDFISPFESSGKMTDHSGGGFFGQQYNDPVQQARYENAMAALLTLLFLVSVLLFTFLVIYRRKAAHEQGKGRAVDKTSRNTSKWSSDESESSSSSHPSDQSRFSEYFVWAQSAHDSASLIHLLRAPLPTTSYPLIVPASRQGRGAGNYHDSETTSRFSVDSDHVGSIIGRHPEFTEHLGSIRSIMGKHQVSPNAPSVEKLARSLSREAGRNQSSVARSHSRESDSQSSSLRNGRQLKHKDHESTTYLEIQDQMSRASDCLGLLDKHEDANVDNDEDTPKPQKRRPWWRKEDDEITLEEMWNTQVV